MKHSALEDIYFEDKNISKNKKNKIFFNNWLIVYFLFQMIITAGNLSEGHNALELAQTKGNNQSYNSALLNYFSNNPLHPSISNQILWTLFYAFSLAMTRRICLTIEASQVSDHFPYSHDLKLWFSSITVKRILLLITFRVCPSNPRSE